MTKNTWTAAAALAALLLASLPVAAQEPVGQAEFSLDQCSDYDNESGFGGTTVKCSISCKTDDVLAVSVAASDNDADVEGSNSCGGAQARCSGPDGCADVGKRFVGYDEVGDNNCVGRTYEAIDSGVTVSCTSSGIRHGLCQLFPSFPVCAPTLAEVRDACLDAFPRLKELDRPVLAELFGTPTLHVDRFVGGHLDASGEGTWVSFEGGQCRSGTF